MPLGWYDELASSGAHGGDTLLGVSINVTQTASLMGFGIISKLGSGMSTNVRMALYKGSTTPLTYVAAVEGQTLQPGRNDYMLSESSSVTLDPGTYWIFANFPASTPIAHDTGTSTSTRYVSLDYETGALPGSIASTTTYNGPNMNYYIFVLPR